MNTPYLPQLDHRHAKWLWLVFLSIFLVAPAPMKADTSINVVIGAPPPPRREVIVERSRPGPDYVWIAGYWGYQYNQQVWVPGHWERPPQVRAVWVEPRWERHGRGYVFVPGYWNERSAYYRHDSRVDREHRRPYGDYYERDRYYDRRHDEIGR